MVREKHCPAITFFLDTIAMISGFLPSSQQVKQLALICSFCLTPFTFLEARRIEGSCESGTPNPVPGVFLEYKCSARSRCSVHGNTGGVENLYRFCFNKAASLAKVKTLFEVMFNELNLVVASSKATWFNCEFIIAHEANNCVGIDGLLFTEPKQNCPTHTVGRIGYD
jgi:hypothetical protein